MASDPTIRAALEAAAMTQCCDNWDEMDASDHAVAISFTAPAIAAFLRAPGVWSAIMEDYEAVTAAVEAEGTE